MRPRRQKASRRTNPLPPYVTSGYGSPRLEPGRKPLSGSASDSRTVLLLVEDEPLVRMFNADVLDDAGFRVVEAANADEAIALFEARPDIRAVVIVCKSTWWKKYTGNELIEA